MDSESQTSRTSSQDFFGAMHPKASFVFGMVTGIAVIAILGLVYVGPSTAGTTGERANPSAVAPTPTPAAVAITPPPVTEEDHVRGDKDAPLTFIEYSDYECPFCKRFHPTMLQMMDEYEGKVKWVFRHFPLSFHDPLATSEATATECANDLAGNDAFWAMGDLIFERTTSNGNGLLVSDLTDFAEELGMNRGAFESCMSSGKFTAHIQQEQASGAAAGITGTPGSFLIDAQGNAQLISGAVPYEQIKAQIDAALER